MSEGGHQHGPVAYLRNAGMHVKKLPDLRTLLADLVARDLRSTTDMGPLTRLHAAQRAANLPTTCRAGR